MRRRDFQRLLVSLPSLSRHQLSLVRKTALGLAQQTQVRALVAERVKLAGQCPHCGGSHFQRWGTIACGEQRYCCRDCRRSFTGHTGTPFNRLKHKDQLLAYVECMRERMSVRETAERLGLAPQRRVPVATSPDAALGSAPAADA